jgi:hypothetical protein
MPINTTSDDFLYVPGPDGMTASYTTTEESGGSNVIIRKVKLSPSNKSMVNITDFMFRWDQKVRKDARISILTENRDGIITTTHTNSQTGNYKLVVPSGENY